METERINVVGLRAELPLGLFKNAYLYADSLDHQSFRVFRRRGLRGFRARRSYRLKTDPRYCLVSCVLNKGEDRAFFEALDELRRDLLIMGYLDYDRYCDEAFRLLPQAD